MATTYRIESTSDIYWTIENSNGRIPNYLTDGELVAALKVVEMPATVESVEGFMVWSIWHDQASQLAVFPTIQEAEDAIRSLEADERDAIQSRSERCLRGE